MLTRTNRTVEPFACLRPVVPRGWPRVQARLVDRTKRAALRQLHRSPQGEVFLLRMYLVGEEATELALHAELTSQGQPDWLAKQAESHLADERKHMRLFANAITQLGVAPPQGQSNWLSGKLMRWKSLAQRYAAHFSHGPLVPAYAIMLCAEQMAVRVLERHCSVIGTSHLLHGLLTGVLDDESKHVRFCAHTLTRIVPESELPHLRTLLKEIRKIERGFGVSGAIAMYLVGLLYSWRHRVAKLAHG